MCIILSIFQEEHVALSMPYEYVAITFRKYASNDMFLFASTSTHVENWIRKMQPSHCCMPMLYSLVSFCFSDFDCFINFARQPFVAIEHATMSLAQARTTCYDKIVLGIFEKPISKATISRQAIISRH